MRSRSPTAMTWSPHFVVITMSVIHRMSAITVRPTSLRGRVGVSTTSGEADAEAVIVTRRGYRRDRRKHAPRRQSFADRKQQTRALRGAHRYVRDVIENRSFEVILPVLDEALALPVVLADLPANAIPLVVDNGST